MKVFEDLVVELQEENLLEETIMDHFGSAIGQNGTKVSLDGLASLDFDGLTEASEPPARSNGKRGVNKKTERVAEHNGRLSVEDNRKRLSEQMASLRSIEYVLTAVEDNESGKSSAAFDELPVQKALHLYSQTCADPESDECFEAESALTVQLETWKTSAAARDELIPTKAFRRYAESANPPLSPQTLFALVRFYREMSFSEQTRSKLDVVLTRLFSKFVDGQLRDLLCGRKEIVSHLIKRYVEWSGGTYMRPDQDDPDTTLLVLTFEDFVAEAGGASDLGELLTSNFFGRICEFKETSAESFLNPVISAAAIECNIRVANKIIDLAADEVKRKGSKDARAKYKDLNEDVLAGAVARTIDLGRSLVIEEEAEPPRPAGEPKPAKKKVAPTEPARPTQPGSSNRSAVRRSLFGVNRWLLLGTILTVLACGGIYFWSEFVMVEKPSTSGVIAIDLEKPELKQYVKVSKVSGPMLYAVVTPDYEKLSKDEQEEYLKKLKDAGLHKGYSRVTLLNPQGRPVGYASENGIQAGS